MTISIIIPVYNVAPYLRECLESVLSAAQEAVGHSCTEGMDGFPHVEVVCVDDGSTDGSGVILDEYINKVEVERCDFVVIHETNAGVSAARNRGLDVATGDWVAFLDGDDLWAPDSLLVFSDAVCEFSDSDLVTFGIEMFQDGMLWKPKSRKISMQRFDAAKRLDAQTLECGFCMAFYRASVIGDTRFQLGAKNGEDRVFFGTVIHNCRVIVHADAVCYGYRQRGGSATHAKVSAKYLKDIIWCWSERLRLMFEDGRELPRSTVRLFTQWMTESIALDYFSLSCSERKVVKLWWIDRLNMIRIYSSRLPRWYRLTIGFVCKIRLECFLFVLFYIPITLKQKGFHR